MIDVFPDILPNPDKSDKYRADFGAGIAGHRPMKPQHRPTVEVGGVRWSVEHARNTARTILAAAKWAEGPFSND